MHIFDNEEITGYCTNNLTNVLVADTIYADHWHYHSYGGAGNIGLGPNSPIWEIFGNPTVKQFDITAGCFAWWYCIRTIGGTLYMNGFNPNVTISSGASTVITPTTASGETFTLTDLSFGMYIEANNSASYKSILNNNQTKYGN